MFKKNSLLTRFLIAKFIGFLIGLLAFIILSIFSPYTEFSFRLAMLLWYVNLGAIIAIFGVITRQPVIKFAMPWQIRSILIGAWLNLIVTLFTYRDLHQISISVFGQDNFMTSPYLFILEGAIAGYIIDYFATKYGSQGSKIIDKDFN